MSADNETPGTPDPDAVRELLLRWLEERRQGTALSAEQMCAGHPEVLDEFRRQIEALLALERMLDLRTLDEVPSLPGPARASPGAVGGERPAGVPGYEVQGELGRGGMGVVCKALQLGLNRPCALKMILSGGYASQADLARFRTEAEAIARLQHPNIVTVYEIGEHEGKPFFSLEYCAGGSLDRKLAGTPLESREAATLVRTLAQALQAAHQANVIHRDLKPSNVLLAEDGTPKVSDFGLARKLDEAGQTQTGAVLGTPSYMAPEQASGKKDVGPAADVYALGAILYECLTGRPPFKAATTYETILQVMSDEPVPPRQLNPRLSVDLETIVLKCLHKQPGKRYGRAADLADDLGRWLAGEPIVARPIGALERVVKWVRRRPEAALAVGTGLLAVLVVAVLAGVAGVQWRAAAAAVDRLEAEQKQKALAQLGALCEATPAAVPAILADLQAHQEDILPNARALWLERTDDKRMRLALLLLPAEPQAVRDALVAWMLRAPDPAEVLLAREALVPHAREIKDRLWARVDGPAGSTSERLRALVALAAFDRDHAGWPARAEETVRLLLESNPFHLAVWSQGLRPIRDVLLPPLCATFRGQRRAELRQAATFVLCDYVSDRPDCLAELLLDADARQFPLLRGLVPPHRQAVVRRMHQELDRLTAWKDPPPGFTQGAERAAERQAKRAATAAVLLLHLGEPQRVWRLFRHSADPTVRSFLIERAGVLRLDPRLLVRRLEVEQAPSARCALILALGEFSRDELPDSLRKPLADRLLMWYRDDPHPGVHGAIDWLLRPGREGSVARPLDWGQGKELERIDAELASRKRPEAGQRDWYVNGQGLTLTIVRGPVEFRMGSPLGERDRLEDERPHRRRIGRTFAIGTKPVTRVQWAPFTRTYRWEADKYVTRFSRDPSSPILGVTWFDAVRYCNWLSQKEGIPRSQWCYPDDAKEGMKPYPDYLSRHGYRLPTEAEWEYACRAGSTTSRLYGQGTELLPRYGWYLLNSEERNWPVGQKRPNDLGLFDLHGSVWNWCQNAAGPYPAGSLVEDEEEVRPVEERVHRSLRGGSIYNQPPNLRSALRYSERPSYRDFAFGVRVCRTLPSVGK
jgi:formylglycine-generating enzyme required for sulfatase activity